jgi:hypothetical protein
MATENGTSATSVQDPSQAGTAPEAGSDLKGKGKATASEEAQDTSMVDDDEEEEEEEAEEVSLLCASSRAFLALVASHS